MEDKTYVRCNLKEKQDWPKGRPKEKQTKIYKIDSDKIVISVIDKSIPTDWIISFDMDMGALITYSVRERTCVSPTVPPNYFTSTVLPYEKYHTQHAWQFQYTLYATSFLEYMSNGKMP